jgi:hypothetical protein
MKTELPPTRIAITALLCHALIATTVPAGQPNIVIILTDDQGYADISLNPHHPTASRSHRAIPAGMSARPRERA